jgi:hypothetical protein
MSAGDSMGLLLLIGIVLAVVVVIGIVVAAVVIASSGKSRDDRDR